MVIIIPSKPDSSNVKTTDTSNSSKVSHDHDGPRYHIEAQEQQEDEHVENCITSPAQLVENETQFTEHGGSITKAKIQPDSNQAQYTGKTTLVKAKSPEEEQLPNAPSLQSLITANVDDIEEEQVSNQMMIHVRPKSARMLTTSTRVQEDKIDDTTTGTYVYHARPFTLLNEENFALIREKDGIQQNKTNVSNTIQQHEKRQDRIDDFSISNAPPKTTEYTINTLSESIQMIGNCVVPISKIVKHFPEQIEKMSDEFNHWSEEYQRLYHDLETAKEKTRILVDPLDAKETAIEEQIQRLRQLIADATMKIRRNDRWIRYRRCRST